MLIQTYFYLEIAENWVFKQNLQICVLQIMQNNIIYPKSQIINYIIIQIFEWFSYWSKHVFMWRFQRTQLLDIVF